jgi:hypothetical protein
LVESRIEAELAEFQIEFCPFEAAVLGLGFREQGEQFVCLGVLVEGEGHDALVSPRHSMEMELL